MKNITKVLLCGIICAAMAVTLTACSNGNNSGSTSDTSSTTSSSATESGNADSSTADSSASDSTTSSDTSSEPGEGADMLVPEEWTNCGDDLDSAAAISGIEFRPVLSNYTVSVKFGVIEVTYPVDDSTSVTIRKASAEADAVNVLDTGAPEATVTLTEGLDVSGKADGGVIYEADFGGESGFYAIYSESGLTAEQVQGAYQVIVDAESGTAAAGTAATSEAAAQ